MRSRHTSAPVRAGAAQSREDALRQLLQLAERLGEKYQVDELASKYDFTGSAALTVPEALAVNRSHSS